MVLLVENIICTKCGNQTHFESKFCIFCGNNLEEIKSQLTNEDSSSYIPPPPQHYKTERKTFFCPKCMHENSIRSYECSNCKEDFEKYNIKGNFPPKPLEKIGDAVRRVDKRFPFLRLNPVVGWGLGLVCVTIVVVIIWFLINWST